MRLRASKERGSGGNELIAGGSAGLHLLTALVIAPGLGILSGCTNGQSVSAGTNSAESATVLTVGVAPAVRKPISRDLTLSSELVPFQEIDVYAKESGFVKQLLVDYGTRVQKDQLMATLEIPELEVQLQQDAALIQSASDQIMHAKNEIARVEAQHKVYHLEAERMKGVIAKQPGLVAQQEIDASVGKDLAAESQVEAAQATLQNAQSQLDGAKAKEQHDRVLFEYSKIKAPFAGVVTQRYANLGTLMQGGTNSSTQALPLVKLSQDDVFRLVIPVPESYVKYIKIGDPVEVRVPSIDKTFPGKVARFSVDVTTDTRTMHTEVDVPNPSHVIIPGIYAEATLMLDRKSNALVVPLQAVNQSGTQATILLVDQNDRLQERQVKLGLETASDAEVISGLNEGDQVVVSDRSGLKDGLRVKPQLVDIDQYKASQQ